MARPATPKDPLPSPYQRLLSFGCSLAIGIALLFAVFPLPAGATLGEGVRERLEQSGVEHEVTAVLLHFRLYDTVLEMAVLLLSVLAVFAVEQRLDLHDLEAEARANPVLLLFVRPLVVLVVLVSVYVLWLGKTEPGGAFQGGILLAAGGLLLKLCGLRTVSRLSRGLLHAGLLLSTGVFLTFGALRLAQGRGALELPVDLATALIVGFEALMLVTVAITALTLVVAAEARGD